METSIGKRRRITSWVQDRRSGVQLHGQTGMTRWQTNNLDRTLLLMQWDDGTEPSYVSPADIEVLQDTAVQKPNGLRC
jgi:hypothetical protein